MFIYNILVLNIYTNILIIDVHNLDIYKKRKIFEHANIVYGDLCFENYFIYRCLIDKVLDIDI